MRSYVARRREPAGAVAVAGSGTADMTTAPDAHRALQRALDQSPHLQSQIRLQAAMSRSPGVALQRRLEEQLSAMAQRRFPLGARGIAEEGGVGAETDAPQTAGHAGPVTQLARKKLSRRQKKARKKRAQKRYERAEERTRSFAESRTWRVWHQVGDVGGYATERTGVPPSNATIPEKLYHVTSYTALPAIRRTGLDPNFVNNKGGLNAEAPENLKYRLRDAALKAIYMGTSSDPGTLMSDENALAAGGKVTLMIKVPRSFALAYYRNSFATGSAFEIADDRASNTVLSFARIPPEYIFVEDPWLGATPITQYGGRFDWRQYATPPEGGKSSDLPSIRDVRREEARKDAMRERLIAEARSYVPPSSSSSSVVAESKDAPRSVSVNEDLLDRIKKLGQSDKQDSGSDDSGEWSD